MNTNFLRILIIIFLTILFYNSATIANVQTISIEGVKNTKIDDGVEHYYHENIKSTIEKSVETVNELLNICDKTNKELVVYISMAFGNPYNDEWSPDLVATWVDKLYRMGVRIIPLSDTVGISSKKSIALLFLTLIPEFPEIEFGLHLHTTVRHWYKKINAAFINGCRRFDTVINGLGGCPMAENRLVGNLRTSNLLEYFEINYVPVTVDEQAFEEAYGIALDIFP